MPQTTVSDSLDSRSACPLTSEPPGPWPRRFSWTNDMFRLQQPARDFAGAGGQTSIAHAVEALKPNVAADG